MSRKNAAIFQIAYALQAVARQLVMLLYLIFHLIILLNLLALYKFVIWLFFQNHFHIDISHL